MRRVLLLATTTGYQVRSFGEAAERLGVELVFATDRCHVIDDPWQDGAIPIRFHEEDASVDAILTAARSKPIDGVVVVGDRPTVIGARVAGALGLPGHPAAGAAAARNKLLSRERLRAAGLPVPWFRAIRVDDDLRGVAPDAFPCVVKPLALSGSRGVIRADDAAGFRTAFERVRAILKSPDVLAECADAHEVVLVEGFIPGREYALEGLLTDGALQTLALFDKPDPLDGPFFEETIYVTPASVPEPVHRAIETAVARAAEALGLRHGPIHAECRVDARTVHVLEVAGRPIGGLCARALRFDGDASLEELLLRHALGESTARWQREAAASGVMMIPIPASGVFRGVVGVEAARAVSDVEDVRITAKPDQRLVRLPEGASYLGFIFARAGTPARVEQALRDAHARLRFTVDPEVPVVQSPHG